MTGILGAARRTRNRILGSGPAPVAGPEEV
jgi:hypothetical protein